MEAKDIGGPGFGKEIRHGRGTGTQDKNFCSNSYTGVIVDYLFSMK